MTSRIKKLLRQHHITTLGELSKDLRISLDKIKNISSGRISFDSLFIKRKQYRVNPKHSKNLAELIGVVLGDGNIFQCDRCQRLTISCNSFYSKYVKHVSSLVKIIFGKEPIVSKRTKSNCTDVRLYLQDIDKALGLPAGNKLKYPIVIPAWIFKKKEYLENCLKGLFETDGHYGLNRKSYVEYMQFCNKSKSLKKSVFDALTYLGYSPQLGNSYVRLARRSQLHRFIKKIGIERPFPALGN